MKLVEILARELGEWPDGCKSITQDYDGDLGSYQIPNPELCNGDQRTAVWTAVGHIENLEKLSAIATDHATAIVTREMWQAERERVVIGMGVKGRIDRFGDPRVNRDRIRAIDVHLADLTLERAERVAELAAEGFALIDKPVEDMSDWRNWRVGDVLEVEHDDQSEHGNGAKKGAMLTIKKIDEDSDDMPFKCSPEFKGAWPNINCLKFHSRP